MNGIDWLVFEEDISEDDGVIAWLHEILLFKEVEGAGDGAVAILVKGHKEGFDAPEEAELFGEVEVIGEDEERAAGRAERGDFLS